MQDIFIEKVVGLLRTDADDLHDQSIFSNLFLIKLAMNNRVYCTYNQKCSVLTL